MPLPGKVPDELLSGPFRSAHAVGLGLTYQQLRGDRFRRLFRDVYVSAQLETTIELRCRGAELVLCDSAVFCGITAARLYGLPVPADDKRIHVAVPADTPTPTRLRGLAVHRAWLPPEHVRNWRGLRVQSPERAFLDLAATLPRVDLVIAGDAMLHRALTTREALGGLVPVSRRRRGKRCAAAALPLLEPGAESPMETRLRMVLIDAGLPRPLANVDVFDEWGEWIARPDLLYPEAQIVIEYEGAHHRTDARQFSHDLARGDLLVQQGYLVLRYEARHVFRQPDRIINRVGTALAQRAPAQPPSH